MLHRAMYCVINLYCSYLLGFSLHLNYFCCCRHLWWFWLTCHWGTCFQVYYSHL